MKRRRTSRGFVVAKRPIDKDLIVVTKDNLGASQTVQTLKTTTFPCTLTGLRWSIDIGGDGGTGLARTHWAIVIVRDGNTANTITTTGESTFYEPEQDVLAFGVALTQADLWDPKHFDGATKTMRKLMDGDLVQFLMLGEATNTSKVAGVVQFFCKS